jgi:hypothetical protein
MRVGDPMVSISLKYAAHQFSLSLVDHQQPVGHVVAQGRNTTHPQSLAFAGGNFVADPLAGDFPLELGKGQQHVEHQAAHGRGGVELLGDGYE